MGIRKEMASGYRWGEGCEAWPLLETGTLSVKQEQMPGGSREKRHVHQRSQQFFYVLQGEALMEIEAETHTVKSGEGIHVAAGRAHRIINNTGVTLEFLVISEPAVGEDRTEI
jgi:mannose-6-phosphate isomerase-like protein (cupin superfamily)